MEEKIRAKKKDEILRYLLDKGKRTEGEELCNALFRPEYTSNDCRILIDEIERYSHSKKLINVFTASSYFVDFTIHTKPFIEKGGFVAERNNAIEVNRKMNYEALQGGRIKDLTERNLKLKVKTHLLPIGISMVSLAFAAYSLLNPSDSISQEVFDTEIESLEDDIKRIEI